MEIQQKGSNIYGLQKKQLRAKSSIYDEAFLQKYLPDFSR